MSVILRNIAPMLTDNFNGFLLDAYGVFWGGNQTGALPGAIDAMERLIRAGKIVGILSNTSQLEAKEIAKLKMHGLTQGTHFHFLITSGGISKSIFSREELPFETPKMKFWLFGGTHPRFSSHQVLFDDSPYTETGDIEEADFIYISIPHIDGEDQIDPELFRTEVGCIMHSGLPMVCGNPDRFAHEGNPPRAVVRQGSIAALYEEMGGQVIYLGKPSDAGYKAAMNHFSQFSINDPSKVLMIGDTPETDIRGAKAFGMPSALITETGIMADRISRRGFDAVVSELPPTDYPDFFIERFNVTL